MAEGRSVRDSARTPINDPFHLHKRLQSGQCSPIQCEVTLWCIQSMHPDFSTPERRLHHSVAYVRYQSSRHFLPHIPDHLLRPLLHATSLDTRPSSLRTLQGLLNQVLQRVKVLRVLASASGPWLRHHCSSRLTRRTNSRYQPHLHRPAQAPSVPLSSNVNTARRPSLCGSSPSSPSSIASSA